MYFIIDLTYVRVLAWAEPPKPPSTQPQLFWAPLYTEARDFLYLLSKDAAEQALVDVKEQHPTHDIQAVSVSDFLTDRLNGAYPPPYLEPEERQQQEAKIKAIVESHFSTLSRKKNQLAIVDDYGNVEDEKWRKEIKYFISKVVKPSFLKENFELRLRDDELSNFIDSLIDFNRSCANGLDSNISPLDYEHCCADLLRQHGWDARITQATGDQGVDIVVSKLDIVGAIQCKKYSTPVGNKAVQEVYAGMQYVGAHFCAVVTNAGYTRSAKELAQTLGVLLLHHDELKFLDEKSRATKQK